MAASGGGVGKYSWWACGILRPKQVEDAVTLDGGKTFLGVARQHLDEARPLVECERDREAVRVNVTSQCGCLSLLARSVVRYSIAALQRVQSESRAWQARLCETVSGVKGRRMYCCDVLRLVGATIIN